MLTFYTGVQKSLRSDFDMAYERGRISVSAEESNTPPTYTRVSTLQTHITKMRKDINPPYMYTLHWLIT